jgi:very-short-patch-repair endonuclease/predicted transcriptional regulator of viral defense system
MTDTKLHPRSAEIWVLVRRQHGVVARSQLLESGFTSKAIAHRIQVGRLHPFLRGVYAVGRPGLDHRGRWMAATLSCGPEALLSHRSAAALWGVFRGTGWVEVVVPASVARRRPGIAVHRRAGLEAERRNVIDGIPVTDLTATLVDFASCAKTGQVERAINEADRLDLIDPETLRVAIGSLSRRPGIGRLKRLLDSHTFTDSGLERRFLAIVRSTSLSDPETQVQLNGYRVDFYWSHLGLVVEADGLVYHRTAGQQATDRRRDQVHAAAGLTTLRFAEGQIRYEPHRVRATLESVAARLLRAR